MAVNLPGKFTLPRDLNTIMNSSRHKSLNTRIHSAIDQMRYSKSITCIRMKKSRISVPNYSLKEAVLNQRSEKADPFHYPLFIVLFHDEQPSLPQNRTDFNRFDDIRFKAAAER
jgi:hypothetical protein